MEVYFLRHAESSYNVLGLINEKPEVIVHITSKGKRQARRVAEELKRVPFELIISSEFARTQETADIVNEFHGVPLVIDPEINETRLGLNGMPVFVHRWLARKDYFNFKIPGDGNENWQDLKERVGIFLENLKKSDYDCVLVVTHQWVLRAANQLVNGLSDEEAFRVKAPNCFYVKLKI